MANWAGIVSDLEALGWSLKGLSQAIDLSPQALSDIKHARTKAPSGMAAVKLHELHARRCGPPTESESEPTSRVA